MNSVYDHLFELFFTLHISRCALPRARACSLVYLFTFSCHTIAWQSWTRWFFHLTNGTVKRGFFLFWQAFRHWSIGNTNRIIWFGLHNGFRHSVWKLLANPYVIDFAPLHRWIDVIKLLIFPLFAYLHIIWYGYLRVFTVGVKNTQKERKKLVTFTNGQTGICFPIHLSCDIIRLWFRWFSIFQIQQLDVTRCSTVTIV